MNTGQSDIDHHVRIINAVLEDLAHRYFRYSITYDHDDETPEVADLAGKIGFIVNVSAGISKMHILEKRIKQLEKDKKNPLSKKIREENVANVEVLTKSYDETQT